jgi:hypothetical protein
MSARRTVVYWSSSSWLLLLLSLATTIVSMIIPPSAHQSAHHCSRNFALFEISDVTSTWNVTATTVSWVARNCHASVLFDMKTWVMGGETSAAVNNDVWYSSDGSTWSQANAAASARRYHVSVTCNHKIWMIRGNANETGITITNNVRYSSDGVAWIQAIATTVWVLRRVITGTLYGDILYSSYNQAITAGNCAAHGGNKNTIPWCLTYAMALFSVILLFSQHEQTSASASVTTTRGIHDQRSIRRRTSICPRFNHRGHSLAYISLLLACVSSQQMAAPSFLSAYSPQHTSRELAGTSGKNLIIVRGNQNCLEPILSFKSMLQNTRVNEFL